MPRSRLYAGDTLRALRRAAGLNQRAMAVKLELSVSYLSQLESGERPLTAAVSAALARHFPSALAGIQGEIPARRLSALAAALADPAVAPLDAEAVARLAEERPDLADRFVALHAAKRAAEERAALAEEAMITSAGLTGTGARLPWEAVRDWFHDAGNYVDVLDRAAEELAGGGALDQQIAEHGVALALDSDDAAPLARFDGRVLTLAAATPPETRRFLVAHRLAALAFAVPIAEIVAAAPLAHDEARRLLSIGLANYAAGALVMPYAAFRTEAKAVRHDIDRLSRRFGVSKRAIASPRSSAQARRASPSTSAASTWRATSPSGIPPPGCNSRASAARVRCGTSTRRRRSPIASWSSMPKPPTAFDTCRWRRGW